MSGINPYVVPLAPTLKPPKPASMATGHQAYDAARNDVAAERVDWSSLVFKLFIRAEFARRLAADLDAQMIFGNGPVRLAGVG